MTFAAAFGGVIVLVVLGIGAFQVIAWLTRWHRHSWFLHSFDTGPMTEQYTGARKGQWITACLECSRCGKRKLIERGPGDGKARLAGREEALVWMRSKCAAAPSHLPEQIDSHEEAR